MMPFSSPPHMVDGSNFMSNSKSYAGMEANDMGCHLFNHDMDLDDQSTPSFFMDHDDENSTPPLEQGDSTNDNHSAGTIVDHEFDYLSSNDHSNVESDDEGSLDLDNGTATQSETEGPDSEGFMRETYNVQTYDVTKTRLQCPIGSPIL